VTPEKLNSRRLSPLRDFLRTEASSAVLLALGAITALVWANAPWASSYEMFWGRELGVSIADWVFTLDLRHWINDGIMTVFFLVVGLEIKRELTSGHLRSLRAAMLPCVAAIGGMLVPAVVYLAIAGTSDPRGWAIPVATDIALAVGVLSVVGDRIPTSVRVFLLGLAIVDDIGAIVIIAVVYSEGMKLGWLLLAAGCVIITLLLQRTNNQSPIPYLIVGSVMWLGFYEAGIHPTIAGVIMGLLAPSVPHKQHELVNIEENSSDISVEALLSARRRLRSNVSVVEWLQHVLHPWTSYLVVPLFAVANSGVSLTFDGLVGAAESPITWGILAGLVLGKPIGIIAATHLSVRFRVADMPSGSSPREVLGAGAAAGIGFTVAMFITELALVDETDRSDAKMAILVASVLAALLSLVLLQRKSPAGTE
jgi:NhaA family Na+:H+ antiporter